MIHILCRFCFWFISVFCVFIEDVSKLLALLRSVLLIQRVTDCYRMETLLFKSTIVSDCAVLGTSFRGTIHYTSNLLPPARLKQCQVCVVAAQLVHQNCFCARCNNHQMDGAMSGAVGLYCVVSLLIETMQCCIWSCDQSRHSGFLFCTEYPEVGSKLVSENKALPTMISLCSCNEILPATNPRMIWIWV